MVVCFGSSLPRLFKDDVKEARAFTIDRGGPDRAGKLVGWDRNGGPGLSVTGVGVDRASGDDDNDGRRDDNDNDNDNEFGGRHQLQ